MAHFFISNYKVIQNSFYINHYLQEKNFFLKKITLSTFLTQLY